MTATSAEYSASSHNEWASVDHGNWPQNRVGVGGPTCFVLLPNTGGWAVREERYLVQRDEAAIENDLFLVREEKVDPLVLDHRASLGGSLLSWPRRCGCLVDDVLQVIESKLALESNVLVNLGPWGVPPVSDRDGRAGVVDIVEFGGNAEFAAFDLKCETRRCEATGKKLRQATCVHNPIMSSLVSEGRRQQSAWRIQPWAE